ncbi:HAD family hydrolase [Devosia albogilva]|uniref:HAD family hydrolase n=1 Tax=Devosia albogilva TaxID=429726 RepID=A0ABW5QLY1_9HYPH
MPLKPGAALLFDIDGTLVDSDPLHLKAFNDAFAPYGHRFDKERFARELQGKANVHIGAQLFPDETPERRMEILDGKEAAFRELAAQGIEPVHGLFALLDWAEANGVPKVAVTNAPRPNADLLLDAIGVRPRFEHVVIGAELEHGKPHPLPYLEGLRLLGADPANSVAFEDSRTGIASATAAGIATIGIATGLDEVALVEAGAMIAAAGYDDERVLRLVRERVMG